MIETETWYSINRLMIYKDLKYKLHYRVYKLDYCLYWNILYNILYVTNNILVVTNFTRNFVGIEVIWYNV